MKRLKGDAYFLIVVMVACVVVIVSALSMRFLTARLLPLLIGSIVFVLAAVRLVQEMMTSVKPQTAVTQGGAAVAEETQMGLRAHLPIIAWILGTALGIFLVGFYITIPVFVLAYMKSHSIKWFTAIISAVITTGFMYGVFEVALRTELYRGLVFTLFS